ncbi:MAG: GNAT family N-acetyltransferase [Bradyrhizobiaceae bacterium]|nr:GNAT family N-acetyltransferase [Bradyrhizobiaceae bacterium]
MTLLARARIDTPDVGRTRVLTTPRLMLRAPRLEDARPFAVLAGDRRIAENTAHLPSPCGIEEARRWIAGSLLRPSVFMITIDGEVIGACSLEGSEGTPDLGCWVGVPFWGCGYATEAVQGLVGHAFDDLGHKAVKASTRVSNPMSRRVLEKCGFQWTGAGLLRIRAISSSVPVDRFLLKSS